MSKNFHIYKSSAGSGKTYTLVKEYLKIVLLSPAKVSHILAVTFTNAAAAEMKERILAELGALISLKEQPHNEKARSLLNQIMKEWEENHEPEIPTEETVINNAGLVLKHILHRYSEFSVSTIDSFVHRVIRTFAFDLFLPFHFDVELDAESLLTQATDTLISRAGIDKNLTELLISFILNQADEEKDLRIEMQIIEMGKALMDEDGDSSLQKLKGMSLEDFLMVAKKLRKTIKAYEVSVANQAKEALTIIEDHQLSSSDFYQTRSGVHGYFNNLASGLAGEKIAPNSYVIRTLEEDKWASGKADTAAKAAIQEIKQTLTSIITSISGPDMLHVNLYKIYTAIGKTIFPVAVLNELEKILEEIKKEHVILHISDFNKKIADIVAEQPVPFIYERLGEKYHHYMIDEFQDTSGLQWQNLLPLIDNALAGGRMSLVVGDGKQAIYRFRNGDVEQFAALPNLTSSIRSVAKPEWEQSLTANQALKNLGTNYRSKQEIVSFNNKFFTYAKDFLSQNLKVIYQEAEQHILPSKTGGYVEITFIDPEEPVCHPAIHNEKHSQPGSNPANTHPEHKSTRQNAGYDQENDPSYQQATLLRVIEVIQRIRDAGHPLSDITILCRANHEASLVARTLLEQAIPVISSESLLLNQSDDVNFIISVIRLLSNQHDQIAAAEILGYLSKKKLIIQPDSLHGCFKEAGLFAKPRDARPSSLPDEIEKILKNNGIQLSFAEFFHQNLYDICETIIRIFFSEESTANPFVAFFSDAVFDFSEKHNLSVDEFLEWWEQNSRKFSLVVPEGIEAIQVMTIHKSKGLQFPVVIMPFASHTYSRLTKKGHWVDLSLEEIPELTTTWIGYSSKLLQGTPFEASYNEEKEKSYLDNLNITYVAFTRAIDKLFVLTKKAKTYKGDTTNGLLQKFMEAENHWQEGQNRYTFGTMSDSGKHDTTTPVSIPGTPPATPEDKQTTASSPLETLNSTPITTPDDKPAHPWHEEPLPPPIGFYNIPSQPWSRVLKMKSHQTERNQNDIGQDYLERGNLLHRAMEHIFTPGDITPVLEQMLANGEIDEQRKKEWETSIQQLIEQPEIARYFSDGLTIKPEAGIFDPKGNYFRPDRVVLMDGLAVVIDYKTGKQYKKHMAQMDIYGNLLRQMGYPQVKLFILYLDEHFVKSV